MRWGSQTEGGEKQVNCTSEQTEAVWAVKPFQAQAPRMAPAGTVLAKGLPHEPTTWWHPPPHGDSLRSAAPLGSPSPVWSSTTGAVLEMVATQTSPGLQGGGTGRHECGAEQGPAPPARGDQAATHQLAWPGGAIAAALTPVGALTHGRCQHAATGEFNKKCCATLPAVLGALVHWRSGRGATLATHRPLPPAALAAATARLPLPASLLRPPPMIGRRGAAPGSAHGPLGSPQAMAG